jgi:hypothetical protein
LVGWNWVGWLKIVDFFVGLRQTNLWLVFCAQRFFLWGEFCFTFVTLSAKLMHTPQRGCTVNAWRRSPIL